MDKVSTIAGLLYLSEKEEAQKIALQLLHGDISLKMAYQNKVISELLKAAERLQKHGLDEATQKKIHEFIQDYLYEMV